MSNCLHDFLYMVPICFIGTVLAEAYIDGPKKAALMLVSLLTLALLILIKHGKTRLKFIVPGVALAVAVAVFFIRMPEERLEYLFSNIRIAWMVGIGLMAFLLGWLMAENRIARRILSTALFGGLIADMILWKFSTKFVIALVFLLILLTVADEVQHKWKKSGYPERKKHLVSIAPFLLVIAIAVFCIPAPEKPVDWSFVIKAAKSVSSFVRSHTVWLHNNEENYEAVIGFSDHGTFTDALGDSRKEIMNLTVENIPDGEIYLSGKTFDTFDGRRWVENYTEDNKDRQMDTMELLCSVDAFDYANIKDYIRRSRATIDFRDFYTNYCFAPGKAIPAFEGINYEQTGGNLVTEKKIGYGTKYTVSYYNLNTDHENFQKYVTHPAKIEEKNWNRIQNQYSFADKLDFEDYEPYKEKMRTLYLPDTHLSDRAEEYMDELLDGSKSDYETLCRIENALSEMGYTWTPGEIPENVDSEEEYLDYFLFEKKEGYCVHFATAFVLMARSRGIPARMVQGFRVNVKSGATMSVKSDTGHAWAEAYLDGVGWLVFDATPGEQHGFYWMSAEERSQYSTGKNNEQNIPEEEKQTEEEDKPVKEKKPFDFRFVYIPLIAVAAFILIYVILERIIRAAAFKKLPDEEKFLSVCRKNFRILEAAGYPMKEGETPAEFGKRVAKELKAEEYAFIKEYERVCYSDKGISDTALETAFADRKALYELLRHTRGKGINYLLMKLSR